MSRPLSTHDLGIGCCVMPIRDLSSSLEMLQLPPIELEPGSIVQSNNTDRLEIFDTFYRLPLTLSESQLHTGVLQEVACEPNVQQLTDQLLFVGDTRTWDHCRRVASLMVAGAIRLGMPEPEVKLAGRIGLLHDIGKSVRSVQEAIYNPSRLDDRLFSIISAHAYYGTVMVRAGGLSDNILQCVGNHHALQTLRRCYGVFRPDSLVAVPEADGKRPALRTLLGLVACSDTYDALTAEPVLGARPYQTDGAEAYSYAMTVEAVDSLKAEDRVKEVILGMAA